MNENTNRMKEIILQLNKWANEYYTLDSPTVSDAKYDKLYEQLVELEMLTGIVLDNSPTKRVGGELLQGFKKHIHKSKLLSLDKAQTVEQLEEWFNKIINEHQASTFSVEYKYDGLTINLTYDNGCLVKAATRGNGEVGEDITEQVKEIKNVPHNIPFKGFVEIQGEGMMSISSMEEYNKKYPDEQLKNTRNGVAGALRNLDPKITSKRNIYMACYSIGYIEGIKICSQIETIDFINSNGLKNNDKTIFISDFNQLKDIIKEIESERTALNFIIDGIVVKVNEFNIRDELGTTSKFPKWAIAYKFEAEQAITTLKDVSWSVGRTGKITPVGLLEKVELAGAAIQRATLNNFDDIVRKDLKIGSSVILRRSNDVIPEILSVVEHFPNSKEIVMPQRCPACNTKLIVSGANLFCTNSKDCKPQIIGRLVHFCSKNACNIEGVSEKTAEILFEQLSVRSVVDLFRLTSQQLLKLDNFKDKRAQNTLDAIDKSKKVALKSFIYALGIDNVGQKTAEDLSKRFGSITKLSNATLEELVSVEEVGEIVAQSIIDYFSSDINVLMLNEFKKIGIDPIFEQNEGKFSGKRFVLTGTLPSFSRTEAASVIEKLGGSVDSSVSKNTNIVIVGDNAGSKKEKAEKLGKEVWSEEIFINMIEN